MPPDNPEESFALEAADHVDELDRELLALEHEQAPAQRAAHLKKLMQTAHTLKGMSAAMGHAQFSHACHLLEDLFLAIEAGSVPPAAQTSRLMLEATAALQAAVATPRGQGQPEGQPLGPLIARLEEAVLTAGPRPTQAARPAPLAPAPAPLVAVRISDQKLDRILARSEEVAYGHTVLQARCIQLDSLCAEFQTLLRRDAGRQAPGGIPRRFIELTTQLENLDAALRRSAATLRKAANGLEKELRELRLVGFKTVCSGFEHMVRETALRLSKEIEFDVEDCAVELDRSIVEGLREPMLHLIRNAVDHGIESRQQRQAAGKPQSGRLRISARARGDCVEVVVEDNGAGIDLAAVRKRALASGMPCAGDQEALELLFRGGLSTAPQVTELSGRGVGLSVVKDRVEQMHGQVSVRTTAGQGSRFVLTVPMTLTRMRLLLASAGGHLLAIPSASISHLMRVPANPGKDTPPDRIAFDGGELKLVPLAALLGGAQTARTEGAGQAVILDDGERRLALAVDDLIAEDDAVAKPLGPRLRSAKDYIGAILMPDWRVAPVLNVAHLMDSALGAAASATATAASAPLRQTTALTPEGPARKRSVLFVDDSPTMRSLAASALARAGYEVQVAAGGRQALEILQQEAVDVLVTDVEMPEMDGLTLAAEVRKRSGQAVKLVVASGRDTSEDRANAQRAGADAYVVKTGEFRKNLLGTVAKVL